MLSFLKVFYLHEKQKLWNCFTSWRYDLFSIFVMMDELTKMLFTELGLESMPQRNCWIADTFFVEELWRSAGENMISLRGSTAVLHTLSVPNQFHHHVPAEGCNFCGVLVSAGNFFYFVGHSVLQLGSFVLNSLFMLYSNCLIVLQKSKQTKSPSHITEWINLKVILFFHLMRQTNRLRKYFFKY